jgi:hypothetical protein
MAAVPPSSKTPWDTRLIDRVSRSSSVANRKLSPLGFFFVALFYSALTAVWAHNAWYGIAWFAIMIAIWQLGERVRRRRSHDGRR